MYLKNLKTLTKSNKTLNFYIFFGQKPFFFLVKLLDYESLLFISLILGILQFKKEFFMNKYFGKIACIAAMSLMSMVAFAEGNAGESGNGSGLFLGLDTGYTFAFDKTQLKNSNQIDTSSYLTGANIGVKAGYNYYFSQMFGVRGYLDYTFVFMPSGAARETGGTTIKESTFRYAHNITLNADLLVNLIQTDSIAFGAFAGIGLGYGIAGATSTDTNGTTTQNFSSNGFILPINLGLSLTANNHHRFELGFKIPTLGMSVTESGGKVINQDNYKTNSLRFFTTSVGYSYIF